MDLAQGAQALVTHIDLGAAAGVVGGVLPVGNIAGGWDAQAVQHGLHRALQGEEVIALAIGAERQDLGFVGQAVGPLEVGAAQLIELRGGVAEAVVPGQDLQQGGEDGGAHDGGILAQGVQDLQGVPEGGVLGEIDLVVVAGGDEGVGDDLVVPGGAAEIAHPVLGLLGGVEAPALGEAGGQGIRDGVVAVEAGDFLRDVGVVLHVGAPGGDQDGVPLQAEAQGEEDAAHLVLGDVGAQEAVDLGGLQLHGDGGGILGDDIHDAVHHLAGPQELHQLAGPLDGLHGVHGIQALLIAGGGVRAHVQGGGGAADGGAVEIGGLKEHHGGVAHDLAVGAAHDAGHADGLFLIADAEHGGGQLALISVQGLDGLALPGGADDDVAALHAGEVEGVHGLAVLQHHVVGDVHDVVDGPDAGVAQPLAHPGGGGLDPDVLHEAGGVAGAEVGVLDVDVHGVCDGAAAAPDLGGVELQGLAEGGAGLPGKADDAEAVGAVGGDLKLHHVVVETQDGGDVVAGLGAVLVEDEDAVRDAVGELRLLGVKVGEGADGVGLGVIGHEVALVEVGTGGLRLRLAAAGVQLHGVAVGLGLAGEDAGADHGAKDLVPGLDVRRDGGLVLLQGVVVVQQGGGGDDGVGVVMLGGEAQLLQGAEHTVGRHAPELALLDLDAAGEEGLVLGNRHQVAHVDVPRAGDDLDGLGLAHVQLADPHVVAVRVALQGEELADNDILQGFIQDLRDLHLGAGESHGLGEIPVAHLGHVHELVEPFTGKFHISTSVGMRIIEN